MLSSRTFIVAAFAWAGLGAAQQNASLDPFVTQEKSIALQGALNNIGPNGSKVPGASAGIVVASPSTVNPDCKSLSPFPSPRTVADDPQTTIAGQEIRP